MAGGHQRLDVQCVDPKAQQAVFEMERYVGDSGETPIAQIAKDFGVS